MEQDKLLLQYENNDLLLINIENERCENKYENCIKDEKKQIKLLTNGNFIIVNAKKRMICQYMLSKNTPVCTKFVRADLNVITVSKGEKFILGGDRKGFVYAWNRNNGRLINSFQAHYGIIKNIVIDQNINVVYTYGDEHCIHVYDLSDIFTKKKIKKITKYQHHIYDRIKQIIPITPNVYYPYKTLVSLTYSGTIYIFGLRSEFPTDVLKTKSNDCNFICSNELFNTHLYLCKRNIIYRICLTDLYAKNKNEHQASKTYMSDEEWENANLEQSEDYLKTRKNKKNIITNGLRNYSKEEIGISHNDKNKHDQLLYNADIDIDNASDSTITSTSTNNSTNNSNINDEVEMVIHDSITTTERNIHMSKYTAFVGHKNEILKCYAYEKKNWLISLAKDGIRLWDLFNCYTIKVLKYGENVINFYVPTPKLFSYCIEFPNLVMDNEEGVKINIVNETQPSDFQVNYDSFLKKENVLLNMSIMFSANYM